ncbi:hypothetical protein SPRG_08091 [Saprolegnia parasitica CBS 223.65]|uniref:START domain-containing protein n=1 Tax=Saprolegnia parasitica (strain CBS 223.65) TaxID=695850 RepID=A0A067CJU2_SAPPC|nr:hypothetical protein SPRG_08091 [Saprolegnia parasitica CBS 223.65]KDO26801.1 hypothetical protein SPRG_08091 [Saprolegnia parasitica CBS 223.65]|eukprot:XP_012202449.1 hypothetical protein SPRG_08091 [Saprolegnia parasitica CBS 223.65]
MQAIFDDFATLPLDEYALLPTDSLLLEDVDAFFAPATTSSPASSDHCTTSDAGSEDLPPPPPKKINVSRKRQRDEIDYLRAKVVELESHLSVLQAVEAPPATVSPWQALARQVRLEKDAAILEREQLKLELADQIEFGKTLEALLMKRPKLAALPQLDADQWKLYRLVRDPTLRREAVANILAHQYEALPGALIESNLLEQEDDVTAFAPHLAKHFDDQLITTATYCKTLAYDMHTVARMTWLLLSAGCSLHRKNFQRLEKFDDDTIYIANEGRWESILNQTRLLMKRFTEADRTVFVVRTILDDELNPHAPDALVNHKSAWFVVEPIAGQPGCRIKYFQKMTLPMVQSEVLLTHPKFSDVNSPYYRIGNFTDAAMMSLREMVGEFNSQLELLLQRAE